MNLRITEGSLRCFIIGNTVFIQLDVYGPYGLSHVVIDQETVYSDNTVVDFVVIVDLMRSYCSTCDMLTIENKS